jgi:hypothetical protein
MLKTLIMHIVTRTFNNLLGLLECYGPFDRLAIECVFFPNSPYHNLVYHLSKIPRWYNTPKGYHTQHAYNV